MYPRLAETFILNEILAHEADGLELEIFSLRAPIDGKFHRELAEVQAKVTYIPGQSVKADEFWSTVNQARREFIGGENIVDDGVHECAPDIYQSILLARAAQERGVTHLHAHFATIGTTVTRLASRMTGIPYSFTAHAKDIYHESVVEEDLRRKLRDAATCVTVSDYNLENLRERFGEDAASVVRIYNGIDLSEFPYESPADRPPLVLGVGRLVDKKGFRDLIDACVVLKERGRDFRCEIIGDGVLDERLAKRVEETGVGDVLRLCGPKPRADVNRRLREAAVMAAPCVISDNGNRDGLPTVLLEAMAAGTPCVSTDVTGIPEVVRDGDTGLMVPRHDPPALADALERMLDDAALRVRLAENARQLIEAEFDLHRNTPALRAVFGTVPAPATPGAVGVA
jgi:glycosyltransferase involved in cell wall biosynthesis